MITKEQKETQVQELKRLLKKSKASFLVQFQGLNVEQMTKIRKELKTTSQAEMKIFRNTLVQKALEDQPSIQEHINPSLTGPNAFVFAFDDPCKVAKVLSNYVEETQVLKIKTGMMEGIGLSVQDIKTLSELPSIEILKSQFLSMLQAPMSRFLSVLSAVPQGVLRILDSYKNGGTIKKKE